MNKREKVCAGGTDFRESRAQMRRRYRASIEVLEQRQLLAVDNLLHISPGIPTMSYDVTGATSFNASTSTFTSTASPRTVLFPSGGLGLVAAGVFPRSFSLQIKVDSSGNLLSGVPGPDLVIKGKVTDSNGTTASSDDTVYDGVLLQGEISKFGYADSGTNTDDFDFVLTPDATAPGLLYPFYGGKQIGITMRSINSNFVGSFATNFSGGANGNVGPVSYPNFLPSSLSGTVFSDLDNNGIMNGPDSPIYGVKVLLNGNDYNGIPVSLMTTTGIDGMYHFNDLVPSDSAGYTITEIQPYPPYLDGKDTVGTLGGSNAINDTISGIVVGSGVSGVSYDFGEILPASVSGYVYYDSNDNGLRDDGIGSEISGATVHLSGVDDLGSPVSLTSTTDGAGHYSFDGLRPSDANGYVIAEDQPAGYLDGQDTPGTGVMLLAQSNDSFVVQVAASNAGTDYNFGELLPASIGDYVWNDSNADGQQDGGEAGIPNVTVNLLDGLGNVVDSTMTNSSGYYLFSNLSPSNYAVQFVAPGGYIFTTADLGSDASDSDADTSTGKTGTYLLGPGEFNGTVDAGLYQPVTIGDYVWNDADANGKQDSGETGIVGVNLTLTGTDGAGNPVVHHATTGAGGLYQFTEAPGTYTVAVDASNPALAGYAVTQVGAAGTNSSNDSNASPSATNPFALAGGDSDTTIDFGYYQPVLIGDYVWNDVNGNGKQDGSENGISGVNLTLSGTTAAGVPVVDHVTTDSAGAYSFNELPGTYSVSVDSSNPALAGYLPTAIGAVGTTAADDSNANPSTTTPATLLGGGTDTSVDFGFYKPVLIGDFVWNDANANGKQDSGEQGISSVKLKLTGTTGAGVAVVEYGYTNSSGIYQFSEAPGTYSVSVDAANPALAGYVATTVGAGGTTNANDSNASPSGTSPAALPGGGSDQTIDFGYYQLASVGDFVWKDTNGNGLQESGELGISGVTVKLYNSSNVQVGAAATTNASGYYLFSGLMPGSYYVKFSLPTGYSFSPVNQGTDDTKDSDASISTGQTSLFTLLAGTSDLTRDAGMYQGGSISGVKYRDCTGNGLTSDDVPLAGTTIKLFRDANNDGVLTSADGAAVASMASAPTTGAYSFTGLAPGRYFVQEVVPTGYIRTAPALTDTYTFNVTSGSVSTGNNFANFRTSDCACSLSNIKYTINGCTYTSLRGNADQGTSVKVTFTVAPGSSATLTLVSYKAPSDTFVADDADQQTIYKQTTGTFGPGTYSMTVLVPDSYYQVDFICGTAIDKFGPAGSNIFYSAQGRLIDADNGGTNSDVDGMSAKPAYWAGTNGQNLIKKLNATSGNTDPTNLASWLSSNFPKVYGSSSSNNLVGKKNSNVAALMVSLNGNSSKALDAQFLATALSVYATTSSLGGSLATSYGFLVSSSGLGSAKFNVLSSGSAFGVSNNSTISVMQMLQGTNAQASGNGTLYNGNSSLRSLAQSIFNNVTTDGGVA